MKQMNYDIFVIFKQLNLIDKIIIDLNVIFLPDANNVV